MRMNDFRRGTRLHDEQQQANAVKNSAEINRKVSELRSQGGVHVDWDAAITRLRCLLDETGRGHDS